MREEGIVGVKNEWLRLKMQTEGNIHYSMESEKMVGTIVTMVPTIFSLSSEK